MSDVSRVVLDQLGGNRFVSMVGAYNLASLEASDAIRGGLVFSFRGCRKYNVCSVRLRADDTYTVVFMRAPSMSNRREFTGIYATGLADLFSQTTGLCVRL